MAFRADAARAGDARGRSDHAIRSRSPAASGRGLPPVPLAAYLLGLSAAAGNRSVAALLQGPTVQRQEQPVLQPAGNPLVGLQQGDGLVVGTFDRRGRVRILQERLNVTSAAGLAPDGMFGPRTSQALAAFQAGAGLAVVEPVDADTADALMGRTPVSGGIAGVPAEQEGAFRALVVAAGSKLGGAELPLGVGGSSVRRVGVALGSTPRSSAASLAGDLALASRSLVAAAGLLRVAGAKMVAGGPTTPALPVGVDNPMVGLARGDGLALGTEDRRPRVVHLQEKLNERMSAELEIDGMFGPKTTQVLQEFQRSIRVPESDVVDQVTADALESGQIGETVAVPGGAELEQAGGLLGEAGRSVRQAGANLAASINLTDPTADPGADRAAGGELQIAGQSLQTAGAQLVSAGQQFSSGSTQDSTRSGGGALTNAGLELDRVGLGFRLTGSALATSAQPLDQALVVPELLIAGGAYASGANLVRGAGVDITSAADQMTPAG